MPSHDPLDAVMRGPTRAGSEHQPAEEELEGVREGVELMLSLGEPLGLPVSEAQAPRSRRAATKRGAVHREGGCWWAAMGGPPKGCACDRVRSCVGRGLRGGAGS